MVKTFEANINLALCNDIVSFVLATADVKGSARDNVYQRYFFLDKETSSTNFQTNYGFLYLGEMLERYEERHGFAIWDIRAIALALACTKEYFASNMFTGKQLTHFIRDVMKIADNDFYLQLALHVLNDKPLPEATGEEIFMLIAVGNLDPFDLAGEIIAVLGPDRSCSVFEYEDIYRWLTNLLLPEMKNHRSPKFALFRAFCALTKGTLTGSSTNRKVLEENGYTPLEIAYLNHVLFSMYKPVTISRLVVTVLDELFKSEDTLSEVDYDRLFTMYDCFYKLPVRVRGHQFLGDILEDAPAIRNPHTLAWFFLKIKRYSRVMDEFNILDDNWVVVANILPEKEFHNLFTGSLTTHKDTIGFTEALDRYTQLTGKDYVEECKKPGYDNCYTLLIKEGLIKLWDMFEKDHSEDTTTRIASWIHGLDTRAAFDFCDTFMKKYGIEGWSRFFPGRHDVFFNALVSYGGVWGYRSELILSLDRDYLVEDERRKLLGWLEEYIFTYKPDLYIKFIVAILKDDSIASMLPREKQVELFRILRDHKLDNAIIADRYMTEEEKLAEKEAERVAKEKKAQAEHDERLAKVRATYMEMMDGTMHSLRQILYKHWYNHNEKEIVCNMAVKGLKDCDMQMSPENVQDTFDVMSMLYKSGCITIPEIINYLTKIEEVIPNVE